MVASALLAAAAPAGAQQERNVTKVAENVYVIRHRTAPFEGGNTTVVIGERDVLVVDATMLPYAAREDIAEIRRLTSKPVRYLVNTHWHNDHVMGNQAYAQAFPGVAIVAHAETKRDMDLNITQAPRRTAKFLSDALADAEREPQAGRDAALLARRRQAVEDYRTLAYQPPTLTFERTLTLDLGGREVHVRHLGRGNTSGDAVVFLPGERIVASGDLLVHPFPFAYDGYPTEWVRTLEEVARLDPRVIVPGHGEVMRDTTYLSLVRDFFRSAVRQVDARLQVIGPAEFQVVDSVMGHVDLSPFKRRFAGDDAARGRRFDQLVGEVVRLVFKEAALR